MLQMATPDENDYYGSEFSFAQAAAEHNLIPTT
jgi:hypothetical protein